MYPKMLAEKNQIHGNTGEKSHHVGSWSSRVRQVTCSGELHVLVKQVALMFYCALVEKGHFCLEIPRTKYSELPTIN